jgi:hypothetical protein
MKPRTRATFFIGALVVLATATGAQAARNFALKGKNELSGGFGFQAGLTDWAPGGFKWFNEYNRELGRIVWLNVQLNFVLGGDHHGGGCWEDGRGVWHCDDYHHFEGWAIEAGIGVKLKWRLQKIPLQFHAKFGGTLAPVFLGGAEGVELGYRGGFGIRYFVVPSLGVGAEFMHDLGPAYVNGCVPGNSCWHFYATFDFNVGVEWRF